MSFTTLDQLRRVSLEYENDEPVAVVRTRNGVHLGSRSFSATLPLMNALRRLKMMREAPANDASEQGRKPKIVVANTFPVWPALGGGQQRILNIYAHLCERVDVTLVSLSSVAAKLQTVEFGPGFREIVVPQSRAHFKFERSLSSRLDDMSVGDIAAIHGASLTPLFGKVLKRALANAFLAIAEHPYAFNALRSIWSGPTVYISHNVEAMLKADMIPKNKYGKMALDDVEEIERACCEHSSEVFVVSERDAVMMADRYQLPRSKIVVLPNGANIPKNPVLDHLQREENKKRLSLRGPIALYVGGLHGPNLDGALLTFKIARQVPDWRFLLVGSMCDAPTVRDAPKPANVDLLGVLGRRELIAIMAAADVGLNPVVAGGGSNHKILNYAANGLLTLTTPIGNRGVMLRNGEQCIVAETEDMPAALLNISKCGLKTFEPIACAGFDYVATKYNWRDIVSRISLPELG